MAKKSKPDDPQKFLDSFQNVNSSRKQAARQGDDPVLKKSAKASNDKEIDGYFDAKAKKPAKMGPGFKKGGSVKKSPAKKGKK